jgi:hypothetical protein
MTYWLPAHPLLLQSQAATTRSHLVSQMEASHQAALAARQQLAELQAQKAAAAARVRELDAQRMDAGT